jgi:tRNA U55 pseudouridine synthase TruB
VPKSHPALTSGTEASTTTITIPHTKNLTYTTCSVNPLSDRTLAHEMGQRLGVGAVAFDIHRTSVGHHSIDQAIRLSVAE